MWFPVISTAQISSVCSLIPRWILRQTRRLGPPCLRACHLLPGSGLLANHERAPTPSTLIPVLSAARQGIAQRCPRGDQEMQRALRAKIGDVHGEGLLAARAGC